jgi:hypothetical protein
MVITGSFDFATGSLKAIGIPIDPPAASLAAMTVTDVIASGASLAIDRVRFTGASANVFNIAHIIVNGGTE